MREIALAILIVALILVVWKISKNKKEKYGHPDISGMIYQDMCPDDGPCLNKDQLKAIPKTKRLRDATGIFVPPQQYGFDSEKFNGRTGLVMRDICPVGSVHMGGPCLTRSEEVIKEPLTDMTPYRHWRMHPGRYLYAWNPRWGARPHYWQIINKSHPAFKCLNVCYGVPHKFDCVKKCEMKYNL